MAARCVTSYGVGGRRRGLAVFLALLAAALGAAPRGALARTLTGRPRPVKSSPSPSPPPALQPAPDYQGVYAIGDSITVAFNADDADSSCSNGDEVSSSWATSQVGDTCASELVYSYAERATCASSGTANTIQHVVNAAESGATIVGDLHNQAVSVKSTIVSNSRTALDNKVLVFLGHNDYCSGVAQKTSASCSSADRDPSLYCTMFPSAVERELNKGECRWRRRGPPPCLLDATTSRRAGRPVRPCSPRAVCICALSAAARPLLLFQLNAPFL